MFEIPEYERRDYEKTNLSRVVFQWRFPPILRLRHDFSADLHDAWRKTYPHYVRKAYDLEGTENDEAKTAEEHHLSDPDDAWMWIVREDAVTLISNEYPGWEDGIERFERFVSSFWDEYEPAYVTRVGLRYQDVLEREDEETPITWKTYLRPELTGWFANDDVVSGVKYANQQMFLEHEEGMIRFELTTRTGQTVQGDPAQRVDMDFDMYKTDLRDDFSGARQRLDAFHDALVGLFEWSITDALRVEMTDEGGPP